MTVPVGKGFPTAQIKPKGFRVKFWIPLLRRAGRSGSGTTVPVGKGFPTAQINDLTQRLNKALKRNGNNQFADLPRRYPLCELMEIVKIARPGYTGHNHNATIPVRSGRMTSGG